MKSLLPAIICLLLFGCSSNEIGNSKDVNPETVYTAYNISYTEGDESARFLAQFRFAGKNGTTLVLTSPSTVKFDGVTIPVDSSRIDGAFYRLEKPFGTFEGKHNFVFTDINGREYPQPFTFKPVRLTTHIPGKTNAADMSLAFEGLADGTPLHVEITDTSSATEDIRRVDTIKNGGILITAADFARLKTGPVNLNFYVDLDLPLENPTKEGGRLNQYYRFNQRSTMLEK